MQRLASRHSRFVNTLRSAEIRLRAAQDTAEDISDTSTVVVLITPIGVLPIALIIPTDKTFAKSL